MMSDIIAFLICAVLGIFIIVLTISTTKEFIAFYKKRKIKKDEEVKKDNDRFAE